ncbi:MAG TPA: hypothetical protein VFB49_10000 [Patescibacteria group bacterium]|jgi:hypothetical protein|nr:hypothetical protein [Patescibacteria group bacterium]
MNGTASLVWDILFGAVGGGYFIYGKKQQEPLPMLCGFGLMIYPYFVSNTVLLVVIGAILMAIPFLFRD